MAHPLQRIISPNAAEYQQIPITLQTVWRLIEEVKSMTQLPQAAIDHDNFPDKLPHMIMPNCRHDQDGIDEHAQLSGMVLQIISVIAPIVQQLPPSMMP